MLKRRQILKLVVGAVIVLLLALMLNSALSISSFEKIYRLSLIAKYQIVAGEIKRNIETALNLGKPFENFHGMERIFQPILEQEPTLQNILITRPDGTILYSPQTNLIQTAIPVSPQPNFAIKSTAEILENAVIRQGQWYYVALPIYVQDQEWVGNVYLQFAQHVINQQIYQMLINRSKYLGIVLGLTIILLPLLLWLVFWLDSYKAPDQSRKVSLRNKSFATIIMVLIISQATYTYLNTQYFSQRYVAMVQANIATIAELLKDNIDNLLKIGLPLNRLKKVEVLLRDIARNIPECQEIKITNMTGELQYLATKDQIASIVDPHFIPERLDLEHLPLHYQIPLVGRDVSPEGLAVFMINLPLIDTKNRELMVDSLTVIAISLLLSFEILLSFFITIDQGIQSEAEIQTSNNYELIRPIAFMFYFADAIPMSFLPLFIRTMYEKQPNSILGLSKDVILGLPISAYWLAVAIFLPLAGWLLGKFPVRRIMWLSASFTVLGFIASAFATNLLQLTIFRMIAGMGYGGMVISGQTFVVRNTRLENRTTGFGHLMAGYYSGTICAAAIGGIMANRLGFRVTLLIAAATVVFFLLFILFNLKKEPRREVATPEVKHVSFFKSLRILKNRSFVAALLFESIPAQIAFIGFIFYACPLYLDSIGVSQSNIGRFLTGFGLSVIFLGPIISRLADKWNNERIFMILGNLLIGAVLASFFFFGSLSAVIISLVTIGIGSALISSTESSYITLAKEVNEIGEANVISVFRTLERIGYISAPIIAGTLIGYLGYARSITAIGMLNIVGILLFTLFSQNLRLKH
ncbi:transporter major facilitator superfamily MFS_1 [Candidatus Moduliflexus flocculans]|uniref:Transporter major facilitator superfamily MFS_1 n=1 Tax=Candidatus Moduliflexus flocculans TaxID=1499966 RepID=A0A081BTB5_9BACT|nr:transporter major facilitator superfamily MFS_1 [Candidatus Moduliflexus flocculans]